MQCSVSASFGGRMMIVRELIVKESGRELLVAKETQWVVAQRNVSAVEGAASVSARRRQQQDTSSCLASCQLSRSSALARRVLTPLRQSRRPWRVRASAAGAGSEAENPLDYRDTDGSASATSSSTSSSTPWPQRIAQFYHAFWRFLRPHTIRGTFLGTTALVMRALLENPGLIDWMLLPKALRGLLALLCGNGYIVGINQIYDFGIDKVNKPFLPIAAGDLSIPSAWALVIGLAALGFGIVATNFGNLITSLYTFGLFLGTIYSVPPMRLKQFAVPAFLIIATVRGFLLNFGVYYATRAALGLPYQWSPSILFITIFVTVFATVIAITKDLPDIEGDKKFDISTFATKLGVRKISMLGAGLLLANYVGAIAAGLYLPRAFKTKLMVAGHATLGICLVYQTWLLDSAKYSKEAIANFYRFIWYLFYSEYAMLPFI